MDPASPAPLAVVTGASHGIGLELAKQFAANGFDLIVAAEDAAIVTVATELASSGAQVESVQVDLATDGGVDELFDRITAAGRPIDAIALNAGVGAGGAFATDTKLDDELRVIDLNVRSTVHLAKHVLPGMVERGEGRVLFTSSLAAGLPGSFHAVYNASKSFVQSFALALREELEDTGVTVTTLMPGPTETEFFERAEMMDTSVGQSDHQDDAARVAEQGFEALMAGKERAVAGSLATRLQNRGSRFIPDRIKSKMHRQMAESKGHDN